jgi:hypothetical protein
MKITSVVTRETAVVEQTRRGILDSRQDLNGSFNLQAKHLPNPPAAPNLALYVLSSYGFPAFCELPQCRAVSLPACLLRFLPKGDGKHGPQSQQNSVHP